MPTAVVALRIPHRLPLAVETEARQANGVVHPGAEVKIEKLIFIANYVEYMDKNSTPKNLLLIDPGSAKNARMILPLKALASKDG